jgi:hypothetical protein
MSAFDMFIAYDGTRAGAVGVARRRSERFVLWFFGSATVAGLILAIVTIFLPELLAYMMDLLGLTRGWAIASLVAADLVLAGLIGVIVCLVDGIVSPPEVSGEAAITRTMLVRACKKLHQFMAHNLRQIVRESMVGHGVDYHLQALKSLQGFATDWIAEVATRPLAASQDWAMKVSEYREIVARLGHVTEALTADARPESERLELAAGRLYRLVDRVATLEHAVSKPAEESLDDQATLPEP